MNKITILIIDYYKRTDKILIALCFACSFFSCLVLLSISQYFFTSNRLFLVQAIASVIGIFLAIFISKIDYRTICDFNFYHVIITWGFVLATFFIGSQRGGADDKAWIQLPLGMTFQPTEIAKFSFILTFAAHLDKVKDKTNDFKTLFLLVLHGAAPIIIVHFQGDDGTALVFFFVFMTMLFCAGLSIKYFLFSGSFAVIVSPIIWNFILSEHQRLRILTIFMPELDLKGIGFQAYQGKVSIGSGGIWGTGLFSGAHRSIPEMQNDFIFAYIGEALGLVGSMVVLVLLTAICIKILMTSKFSDDNLGMLIAVGVSSVFIAQIILNIGMCLSLMPVIGVTLPFFSSGGTSVTSMYVGIGLVLSIYFHNKDLWFN
ncbi:MAG: FtsW/RodA/SpoVE family cell cycle protein [Oscillospiraceae bacterium]